MTDNRLRRAVDHERVVIARSGASAARDDGAALVVGGVVTALGTVLFFGLFWNRFLGLRSGDGGFSGAVYFLKGILPYRDYYAPVPPLFGMRCAAILAVFGKVPIALRGFGVLERMALGLVVYAWLARFFRAGHAAMAALVAVVVSAGDYADPVNSYNHFTILLATAAGYITSFALDPRRSRRALAWIGAAAGLLTLLCVGTKQTVGVGMTVAIPLTVLLCLGRAGELRGGAAFVGGFIAGWGSAGAALAVWMWHAGILRAFFVDAFVKGPAAKASYPGAFFIRMLGVSVFFWWAVALAVGVLWLQIRPLRDAERAAPDEDGDGVWTALAVTAAALAAAWLLGSVAKIGNWPLKPAIYVAFLGSAYLIGRYLQRLAQGRLTVREAQFGLFAVVAFINALALSLSFPAFEAMAVPGLGLTVALFLARSRGWRRGLLYTVCGLLIFCTAKFKLEMPFGFDGWIEAPVKSATAASALPELRGLRMAPETARFVDATVALVRAHSEAGDTIFTYPVMAIFYGLTERRPATSAWSHNIDTVPDGFARGEAERLRRARPAVIIYGRTSEEALRQSEGLWRGGRPSGQRDLIAAIETLAGEYRVAGTFEVGVPEKKVLVYVRADR